METLMFFIVNQITPIRIPTLVFHSRRNKKQYLIPKHTFFIIWIVKNTPAHKYAAKWTPSTGQQAAWKITLMPRPGPDQSPGSLIQADAISASQHIRHYTARRAY